MKRRPSSTRATSFKAGGIDLHQAVCGLDRSSYPAAQREIFGQHFFSALKRELGPVDALPGIGNFRCQNIGRRPVAVRFHSVHGFLIHGGRYRSLISGETAGRRSAMGRMTNARPVKTAPETGERLRPLYIPRAEAMTVQRAIDLFRYDYNVSEDTLRRLVIKHRLHNQTMPGVP
ncbi:hypothetical protein NKI54_31995 [Mesorhizobium sp. M0663]|uniref:hypothetical protein n=1 Tax=Mesorhizobium sp. M0663 TaxID=2956981 RepID=UPI00333DD078